MNTGIMKRSISIVLVFFMLLSLLPLHTGAAETEQNTTYLTDFWTNEVSGVPRAHIQIIDEEKLRVTLYGKEHNDTKKMRLAVAGEETISYFEDDTAMAEVELSNIENRGVNDPYGVAIEEVNSKGIELSRGYRTKIFRDDGGMGLIVDMPWATNCAERSNYAVEFREEMNRTLKPEDYLNLDYDEYYSRYRLRDISEIREIFKKMEATTLELTKDCKNDTEKALAIHDWIGMNILYQHWDGDQSGFETYEYGAGVCNGITMLYVDMLRLADVPAVRVTGRVGSAGPHAWTAVYLQGAWRFVDMTTDSDTYYDSPDEPTFVVNYRTYCADPQIFGMGRWDNWSVDKPNYNYEADGAEYLVTGEDTVEYCRPLTENEEHIVVPETVEINDKTYKVTSVAGYALAHNDALKTVVIGNNVSTIRNVAFGYCDSLESVVLGEGVTSIGRSAFRQCQSLKSITIGENVRNIGPLVFGGCRSLKTITIKSKHIDNIEKKAFKNIHKKATFKLPREKFKKYRKMIKASDTVKKAKFKKI